jgi:hypothetical protein
MEVEGRCWYMATISHEPPLVAPTARRQYEYRVLDTGKDLEGELNRLGALGWRVVGVTTKKQLFIAPPQAIILMRELQEAD